MIHDEPRLGGISWKQDWQLERDALETSEPRHSPSRPARRMRAVAAQAAHKVDYPIAVAGESIRPFVAVPESAHVGLAEECRLQPTDLLGLTSELTDLLARLEACARLLSGRQPGPIGNGPASLLGKGGSDAASSAAGQEGRAMRPGTSTPGTLRQHVGVLTRREAEVLQLVGAGKASKEIAEELCVTVPTVSRHIANIYAKIDARNRADATRYALGMQAVH